jgi:formyltetrahydrofolate-dependent phosphoribosylglycinamide formyltransferase
MSLIRPLSAPLERPLRLAVFISGTGTTLENLLRHIAAGDLDAQVCVVLSDRPGCVGVEKARTAGLAVETAVRKNFESLEAFSNALFAPCDAAGADLVILGGFFSLLAIPPRYACRVMNIHPSLIPAFCGKGFYGGRVHEAVLERGCKVSGCTVHFADNQYDHGPIIVQKTVPVLDGDTPETLRARVFTAECEAYPEAIRLFASARIEVEGRRVRLREL